MREKSNDLINTYDSFLSVISNSDDQTLSSINKIESHYICTKYLKFPYIIFVKIENVLG